MKFKGIPFFFSSQDIFLEFAAQNRIYGEIHELCIFSQERIERNGSIYKEITVSNKFV